MFPNLTDYSMKQTSLQVCFLCQLFFSDSYQRWLFFPLMYLFLTVRFWFSLRTHLKGVLEVWNEHVSPETICIYFCKSSRGCYLFKLMHWSFIFQTIQVKSDFRLPFGLGPSCGYNSERQSLPMSCSAQRQRKNLAISWVSSGLTLIL